MTLLILYIAVQVLTQTLRGRSGASARPSVHRFSSCSAKHCSSSNSSDSSSSSSSSNSSSSGGGSSSSGGSSSNSSSSSGSSARKPCLQWPHPRIETQTTHTKRLGHGVRRALHNGSTSTISESTISSIFASIISSLSGIFLPKLHYNPHHKR